MKKTIMILLTAMLAMVISACAGDKASTIEVKQSAKEIADQMVERVEQPAFMELSAQDLSELYKIDYAKLADFSVRMPLMNVKSNEFAIFKVNDTKDIPDIEAAVKQRAADVQKQFEQYLPDQYENAKNYKVITKGNYVLFVISDRADELIKVYESFFKTK